ncbi:MAG: two-component regulator propeller domain-containing protein [Verrucomicrobiota bacterium]
MPRIRRLLVLATVVMWIAIPVQAVVLWSDLNVITVTNNGPGTDLLGGAVKRDDHANDTLYFKFHVDPLSDATTEPYFAALELYDGDSEHLGIGNALEAWGYSAFFKSDSLSDSGSARPYIDLHSARPDASANGSPREYQLPHRGVGVTIIFKVQFVAGSDDLVTVWLNPDLGPGATEAEQPEALTTRFNADASFDELRLRHAGDGGGWTFGDLAIATSFNDFIDLSSDRPASMEADLSRSEGALSFRSWEENQGLLQRPVRAIAQTRDGYIWVAGGNDLYRFDGLKFVSFAPPFSPARGRVQALFGDRRGALWAGTTGGLQCWLNGSWSERSTRDGLPSNSVTCLNEDGSGRLWAGTEGGLVILQDGRFVPPANSQAIAGGSVTALFKDRQGAMWVAIRKQGVFAYHDGQFVPVTDAADAPLLSTARGLLVDQNGCLWLAAGENAVLRRDQAGWHHYRLPKRLAGSLVNALAEEPDGTIWAGAPGGLFQFSGGQFSGVPNSSKLAGAAVESLFADRDGRLWAGTDEGLNRLQRKILFAFGQEDGLGFGPVQGLVQVSPGVIWAARSGDGIYRWDGRTFSRLKAAGLPAHNSRVNALLLAHDGVCWVASSGGLLRYKDPVAAADEVSWFELAGADIVALAEDRDGGLWAGTRTGAVWRLFEGQWAEQDSVPGHKPVHTILPDPDGSIWVGTGGAGLVHLKTGAPEFFGERAGLADDDVRSLYRDAQGTLWIGTAGGLCRKGDGRISCFSARDGLPDNTISQIMEDEGGRLWLGTGQGIACVSKRRFEDFAAGKVAALYPRIFNRGDGMLSEECVAGSGSGGLKTQGGFLWFPTAKGVTIVAPRALPLETPMPNVALEDILVDGVPVKETLAGETSLRIPPGKHRLEIHYTGLWGDAPETIRFRYKLDEWDAGWIEADTSRTAVYNFVPAGDYDFHVIACNRDGTWAAQGAELRLVFARYFWQSWWFIGLAGGTLLLAVAGTVRVVEKQKMKHRVARLERERALDQERTRIAQDLHDEMGAKLCRISFLSEHARRAVGPDDLREQIKSISDDSREVLHSLDEIVWAVNPQNDTLENAASYLAQYAQDYFQMTGVECELELPAQLPPHPLSSQSRHHLFLAVREALANILKHSGATRATIAMACQNAVFEVVVTDNGRGFDGPAGPAAGATAGDSHDGVRNMRQRIADVGGRCSIESAPGRGTSVRFSLPIPGRDNPNKL